MTKRKFTPPEEFPAEYVDGNGDKVTILGRGPHKVFPFIGYDATGHARYWTELGVYHEEGTDLYDLHDTPKRLVKWHNVYGDWLGLQYFSRSDADKSAGGGRLCVYRFERDEDGGNFEVFREEV